MADYDELDDEDHMRLSRVLSDDNTLTPSTTKTLGKSEQPAFNHMQPLPSLPSAPVYNPGPVFNFHNSTVIFEASSSTNPSQ